MTTETMEAPTQTEAQRLAALDARSAAMRTMVLILTVEPENWELVHAAVSALRSGLAAPHLTYDKEYVNDFLGPFEVDQLDGVVIEAIGMHCEGNADDNDPDTIQGRAIRLAARQFAGSLKDTAKS